MPDGDTWPASPMLRSGTHAIAERAGRRRAIAKHGLESFLYRRRASVRQPGYNRASCEHLRIRSQHDRRHCTARREAGHEDSSAIDAKLQDSFVNHLADRKCLAAAACNVTGQEPRKAVLRVICRLLFGVDDDKALLISKLGPTATMIID